MSDHQEHIACIDFVRLVSDYIEGALGSDEASLVEEHLNFCDGCERYLDQMRETLRVTGMLREEEVPSQVRAALLAAFRNRTDQ